MTLIFRVLCFRVVEPMGFAKMRFKVIVKMGRSKHTFHHEHSKSLLAKRGTETSRLI